MTRRCFSNKYSIMCIEYKFVYIADYKEFEQPERNSRKRKYEELKEVSF